MMLLSSRDRPRPARRAVLFFLAIGVVVGSFVLVRETRLPAAAVVEVAADLPAIGQKGVVDRPVREPKLGVSQVVVTGMGRGFRGGCWRRSMRRRTRGGGRWC
jgi:hypothetical protein